MNDQELYHYGVQGMKWYQHLPHVKARKSSSGSTKSTEEKPKPKTAKTMTDDELRSSVQRLQLEKQYKQLYAEMNPVKVSKGKQFVQKQLGNMANATGNAVTNVVKTSVSNYVDKQVKKAMGLDAADKDKAYIDQLKKTVNKMAMEKQYRTLKAEAEQHKAQQEAAKKAEEEAKKRAKAAAKQSANKSPGTALVVYGR